MSEPIPVKKGRGRPPKKLRNVKAVATPESTPSESEISAKQPIERPGRRRSVPAKYLEDFVMPKVINIAPEEKLEDEEEQSLNEDEGEENEEDDNNPIVVVQPGTSSPANGENNAKRKRGRPIGWRKYPEQKPEVSKSPRPRGRPLGSLGKKNKTVSGIPSKVVTGTSSSKENKPQYYYLESDEGKQGVINETEENKEENEDDDTSFRQIKKQKTEATKDEEEVVNERTSVMGASSQAIHESPKGAAKVITPANITTGNTTKRRLFVRTKDGKFLRLPDNSDSLKLLSSSKLVLPSKPVPAPPVQLSLVGAQPVSESAMQMKKMSFSNVHRIDELLKVAPVHAAKRNKEEISQVKQFEKRVKKSSDKPSQYLQRIVQDRPNTVNALMDSQEWPERVSDDEEQTNWSTEDEEDQPQSVSRPDHDTLLRSLVQNVNLAESKRDAAGDHGWNYQGSEPLSTAELLLYSLLHCQGALLNYTQEKRQNEESTVQRCYNAMTLLGIRLPGDVYALLDYVFTMDDPMEASVGKLGSQRRWKYFFKEIQQTVKIASSLLCSLLIQHWTEHQTVKLLSIVQGICTKANYRLKAAPAPTGHLNGASLKHVLRLIETQLHKAILCWHVRYIPKPEMIVLNRTIYNTEDRKFQVINITLCILPSLLVELRINDQVVDFLLMGFSTFPGPLQHVQEIATILQQISQAYVCNGFVKLHLHQSVLKWQVQGNGIYKDTYKTGKPIARIAKDMVHAQNCTVLCLVKPGQAERVTKSCGACRETKLKLQATNVTMLKRKRKQTNVCSKTGRRLVDLLREEQDLTSKLTRQVSRLKAGIAKFCMPGPYVDPAAASMGQGEQGFPAEVDSEEVVMATSSVEQQHQQHGGEGGTGVEMGELEVPLEHALMMIN